VKDKVESSRFIPAPRVGGRYFYRLLRKSNYCVIKLLVPVGLIAVAIIAIPHDFYSKHM
jgi:hypothetical protein